MLAPRVLLSRSATLRSGQRRLLRPRAAMPICRRGGVPILSLLLVLQLSATAQGATPVLADDAVAVRAGAWLGACDNDRDCTLFGFADDDSAVLMLWLPHEPGAGRQLPGGTLLLRPEHPLHGDALRLQAGRRGAVLSLRVLASGTAQERAAIDGSAVRSLLPQLRQSGRLLVAVSSARPLTRAVAVSTIRLAGASTVLDWIDRTRRRTPSLERPIGALPSPDPSLPPPPSILPMVVAALPTVRACARQDSGRPGEGPSGIALSSRTVLWRVPCGSGNFSQDSLFVLADGTRAVPAGFDSPPQFPVRAPGILVNAQMDEAGVLSATEPSRGLEDCGDVRRFRWDGSRFRLVWAQLMPVCHGLAVEDWPVVFRAGDGGVDAPP